MLKDKLWFKKFCLINVSTSRVFQLFFKSELGFLIATLLFDMLIDPINILIEMNNDYDEEYLLIKKIYHFSLIAFSIICILLILFSYYAIDKGNRLYVICCLSAQLLFILIVSVKYLGLLLDFVPCFWNEIWITLIQFCFNLLIPIFSSILIVFVYLNEINFNNVKLLI